MAAWDVSENPYTVLELPVNCTKEELKKKYRRLVLDKHPDKQPGNKHAAQEFIRIQRSYEILNDDKAREAWQALERAKRTRESKQAGQSAKRRKMAEDLEKREREYEVERNQERAARNKLNAELARLRKEMAEREAEKQATALRERVASSLSGLASASSQYPILEAKQRTLKVSWDVGSGTYSVGRLKAIFEEHGSVEDVVIRQPKREGKGSALITMTDLKGAAAAADAVSGDLENPLLVVPIAKVPGVGQAEIARPAGFQQMAPNIPREGKPVFGAFRSEQSAAAASREPAADISASVGTSHSSFESSILAKMRQRAERDKQLREAQQAT